MTTQDVSITLQMVVAVAEADEPAAPGVWDTSDLARALLRELARMSPGLIGDHIIDQYECPRDGDAPASSARFDPGT